MDFCYQYIAPLGLTFPLHFVKLFYLIPSPSPKGEGSRVDELDSGQEIVIKKNREGAIQTSRRTTGKSGLTTALYSYIFLKYSFTG